ncbi:IS66 family transposase, partial [Sinorhizobium meliloti]|uniref:IS66 family transposase n=1 Tax=Rhizobium meliloti TaxID=382 RepID=UPI001F4155C5
HRLQTPLNRGRDHPGNRGRNHLGTKGRLHRNRQADAYTGYIKLYLPDRRPGPITETACWVHARRPFYAMADVEANARRRAQGKKPAVLSPIALDMVQRIDALFAIEREINGQSAEVRKAVRQERSKPLVLDLEPWMKAQRAKLSRNDDLAKAFDYLLNRGPAFTLFLDDGRVCLSNNAAERALRWLFAGTDRGGQRAAAMYSLIISAKMNGVDPQAWLADVLHRIAGYPAHRIDELLPWHWKSATAAAHRLAA